MEWRAQFEKTVINWEEDTKGVSKRIDSTMSLYFNMHFPRFNKRVSFGYPVSPAREMRIFKFHIKRNSFSPAVKGK